eukprot:1161785-Pelagomonas_calceolata.AAC.1
MFHFILSVGAQYFASIVIGQSDCLAPEAWPSPSVGLSLTCTPTLSVAAERTAIHQLVPMIEPERHASAVEQWSVLLHAARVMHATVGAAAVGCSAVEQWS